MARIAKKKEAVKETAVVTRAEKKDATKKLIREILSEKSLRHNELIDEVSKAYTERYGEQSDNVNDVKGRVGSVLDIMKKEGDLAFEGGVYALKARTAAVTEETTLAQPVEKTAETIVEQPVEKTEQSAQSTVEEVLPVEEEKPKKRGRKPKAKTETEKAKSVEETKTEEVKETLPVAVEEKPAPKKRGRKPKIKVEEAPIALPSESVNEPPMVEVKSEESVTVAEKLVKAQAEEKTEEVVEKPTEAAAETPSDVKTEETPTAEAIRKTESRPVVDMSFLLGSVKPSKEVASNKEQSKKQLVKTEKTEKTKKAETVEVAENAEKKTPVTEQRREEKKTEQQEVKTPVEQEAQSVVKQEEKIPVKQKNEAPVKQESKEPKQAVKTQNELPVSQSNVRKLSQGVALKKENRGGKTLTPEEKLRDRFLSKLRSLGGDYFEYYSVYLLERYSMKNGRRLEGLRVSGGDHDGGIDGEIELTDKLGFRETIYIQSKNWNPEKGDERLWVVGETLLQQFIGACACRQAKDGKQNCRGIFITTSRFTTEAKRILDTMSDKVVGYDGEDVFEAAKECSFGLIRKNGQWTLDEELLSGAKAFFNL